MAWTKFSSFVEALGNGQHDLGANSLMIALSNTAPLVTDTKLSDITQISSAGGYAPIALPITDATQTGGVYTLSNGAATFTASGAAFDAFRYYIIYDDTTADDLLICYGDYGVPYALPDGQPFTINAGTVLTIA